MQKQRKLTKTKTESSGYDFGGKSENFRGFQVFNFALYLNLKTWKSQKVFCDYKFWQFL